MSPRPPRSARHQPRTQRPRRAATPRWVRGGLAAGGVLGVALLVGGVVWQFTGKRISTLTYCIENAPQGFDPHLQISTFSIQANLPLYERLVELGSTEQIRPALAQSWSVSDDGRVYTFRLQKNVAFHTTAWFRPSRPLNADDVVFSFKRLLNPQHPFNQAHPVDLAHIAVSGLPGDIQSVEKVDEHTVRFQLHEAHSDFLNKLTMGQVSILSAEWAGALQRTGRAAVLNRHPVGTGPYRLVGMSDALNVVYEAHPDYRLPGQPHMERLVLKVQPDAQDRLDQFRQGACQIMALPRATDLPALRTDPGVQLIQTPGLNVGYVQYNLKHPILKQLAVREALDMAINRTRMIDTAFLSMGTVATSVVPPGLLGHDPAATTRTEDPEAARTLLAKAGFPDGFDLELSYAAIARSYLPDPRHMAELLREDWARIGVRLRLVTAEWDAFLTDLEHGRFQAGLIGGVADYPAADNFLQQSSCAAIAAHINYSAYCNAEFDALIERARRTTDPAERQSLQQHAARLLQRDLPWSVLAHSLSVVPVRAGLQGLAVNPTFELDFRQVRLP